MKHIQTFERFLNEYQTYDKYKKGSWGTPEDLKNDVTLSAKHLIPVLWKDTDKYIKSVEDQSDETKGIKFVIELSTNDTITGYKVGSYRSDWEWFLNNKKLSAGDIVNALEEKMYKPFERWQRHHDMSDKSYSYSDDPRSYKSGTSHDTFIQELYNKLSAADKKKADEYASK